MATTQLAALRCHYCIPTYLYCNLFLFALSQMHANVKGTGVRVYRFINCLPQASTPLMPNQSSQEVLPHLLLLPTYTRTHYIAPLFPTCVALSVFYDY